MHIRPNSRRRTLPTSVQTFAIYTGLNTAPGDRPWYQGTYGKLTWGKSEGGESMNIKTQYEPGCFYNIHFSMANHMFKDNAGIFLVHFT